VGPSLDPRNASLIDPQDLARSFVPRRRLTGTALCGASSSLPTPVGGETDPLALPRERRQHRSTPPAYPRSFRMQRLVAPNGCRDMRAEPVHRSSALRR
jgi:hypothetical protein